jgi:hypothetical protein
VFDSPPLEGLGWGKEKKTRLEEKKGVLGGGKAIIYIQKFGIYENLI